MIFFTNDFCMESELAESGMAGCNFFVIQWFLGLEERKTALDLGIQDCRRTYCKKEHVLPSEVLVNHLTTSTVLITIGREWLFNGI